MRSPTTASGVSSGTRQEKHSPFSLARTERMRVTCSNIRRRLKGADSSSSLPDSILAESSRSFRSVKSRSADPLAVCRQSWTVGSGRLRQGHVDHAQDGIHGRAELMAHVRQELALLAWLPASAARFACCSSALARCKVRDPLLDPPFQVVENRWYGIHRGPPGLDLKPCRFELSVSFPPPPRPFPASRPWHATRTCPANFTSHGLPRRHYSVW